MDADRERIMPELENNESDLSAKLKFKTILKTI